MIWIQVSWSIRQTQQNKAVRTLVSFWNPVEWWTIQFFIFGWISRKHKNRNMIVQGFFFRKCRRGMCRVVNWISNNCVFKVDVARLLIDRLSYVILFESTTSYFLPIWIDYRSTISFPRLAHCLAYPQWNPKES